MYDLSKRIECKDLEVSELKKVLANVPDNCKVVFMGDNYGYIHIEEDLSVINFDDASLDEEYESYGMSDEAFKAEYNFRECKDGESCCGDCAYGCTNGMMAPAYKCLKCGGRNIGGYTGVSDEYPGTTCDKFYSKEQLDQDIRVEACTAVNNVKAALQGLKDNLTDKREKEIVTGLMLTLRQGAELADALMG